MEATALSVGKAVLDGALGYANSAFAEEVALQLGVHRDHAFIRDELEMMRAFLMAAHEEREEHAVVKIWVKQVRDVAYDAEDSLQNFAVRLGRSSWWRLPCTLLDRRRVATQMKELRAKVEDVSQRNVRYQLIRGSGSKAATAAEQSNGASTVMCGNEEEIRLRNKAKLDLIRLIHNKNDYNLRVIAIWGTSDVFMEKSIVKRAYDDMKRDTKFECQAWISISHPFNRMESLQNIVRQLFVDSLHEAEKTGEKSSPGVHDLRRMGTMKQDELIGAFQKYLNQKSFLIVFYSISSKEEWDQIKECFPTNKKGSRLIACTQQVEVASLCVGKETEIPEHKQLSTNPTLFAFFEKGSPAGTNSMETGPNSVVEITDNGGSVNEKRFTRMPTIISAFKESQLIGRTKEKSQIIKLVSYNSDREFQVTSIWGMGGVGKTTLVKQVYQDQDLCKKFDCRACVTVRRPFNQVELHNSLVAQLGDQNIDKTENQQSLTQILERKKCFIILDDLSSTEEWDAIKSYFPMTHVASQIIVTTRVKSIAKYCSKENRNIHKLEMLGEKDACDLFTKKVFGKTKDLDEQLPELAEVAKMILKKCNGLPLAIVTIGGFLSKQPRTPMEWRKLNEHIGAELEMNRELGTIHDILIKSYDGLPYHLKSCFLYMSIFPEDHNISRRRLVRRWIAEGYSHGVRSKSLKDIAESYFMELIDRSMILPFQKSIGCRNGIDSCQIHDLMREISISKSLEENLVFRLEEGYSSNTLGATTRHLSISSNWDGDESEFESVADLSRIRSLTVFGKWKPFYISEKMMLLRVLDLEGTTNVYDHHLTGIGQLLHLKYLSLRGCLGIFHLPDSLCNLKQLQTLDVYDTGIVKLPQCIIKLQKLQYIRGASVRDNLCYCPAFSLVSCVACCNPGLRTDILRGDGDNSNRSDGDYPNMSDACTWYWHKALPLSANLADFGGIVMPRGLRNLKALHTLGVVNIARGASILKDIGCLTQLHKLAVTGMNMENCQEFCSILAYLTCLESLSVKVVVEEEPGLHGCLNYVSSPPKSLQSLKLYGNLVAFPKWIEKLQNLVKLKLEMTMLPDVDGTMKLLGKLPNLAILRLFPGSFDGDSEHRLTFFGEAPFQSLMVLDLDVVINGDLDLVEFKEKAAPNLELLRYSWNSSSVGDKHRFSGLASLPKLKEFQTGNHDIREDVKAQLVNNRNMPILKIQNRQVELVKYGQPHPRRGKIKLRIIRDWTGGS